MSRSRHNNGACGFSGVKCMKKWRKRSHKRFRQLEQKKLKVGGEELPVTVREVSDIYFSPGDKFYFGGWDVGKELIEKLSRK